MTLVASFSVKGAPVVIGDVLISTPEIAGRKAHLPILGEINSQLAVNALPFEVGVRQKVNIISDNLVVAWAGSFEQAERVLRVLRQRSDSGELQSEGDLKRELEAIAPEKVNDLWLVGSLLETERGLCKATPFGFRAKFEQLAPFGAVYAAGTGAPQIKGLLNQVKNLDAWDNLHPTVLAAGAGINFVAVLTGNEILNGQNLAEKWGGGFEICCVRDRKFQKIGNRLHTFWIHSNDGNQTKLELRPNFYKVDYSDDLLLIRTATGSVKNGVLDIEKEEVHVVTPVLKDSEVVDTDKLQKPSFDHEFLCCHVQTKVGIYSVVRRQEPEIVFSPENGKFAYKEQLVKELADRANAMVEAAPNSGVAA